MKMRIKILFLSLLTLAATFPAAALETVSGDYAEALELYSNGMYERARTIFESRPDDPMSQGYAVLCAMKMRSADAQNLFERYMQGHKSSPLAGRMHHQQALILFDRQDYAGAASEFDLVPEHDIPVRERTEAAFKRGYCAYAQGLFDSARPRFREVEGGSFNDYTSSARYLLGYMAYQDRDFTEARKWFSRSTGDPRFRELSEFYLVDCEFNLKDYDYVLDKGVAMFESVPAERRERLARSISESYLVKGDKASARKYYDSASHENMTRSDLFYAGSVLYAVEDWRGAVENFSKMPDRTDSLGQVANYQMAGSYIKLRNNVAAMDAFKAAAEVGYDKEIQEDAFFNYAKLAFDLNKDPKGFTDYIAKYSTRTKGAQIYEYMALAALVNRDYAAAVEAYDNIDELTPDMQNNYTKANYLRARQLIASGAWSDAVPCLRTTAYYLPKNDRLNQLSRYWLAECQYNSENYGEACSIYTDLFNGSALDGTAEGATLPYNIAYCNFRERKWAQAAHWFDTYTSSDDRSCRRDALVRRADCDFSSKDYKAAVRNYQKALDEFASPDDIYPYYQQAMAYGLSGDRNRKVEVLSRVLKAPSDAPMYSEAMYELGRAQMDNRDNAAAVNTFNTLMDRTSDSTYVARALIGLGMVRRNTGDYESALSDYKRVVAMLPGSSFADDALLAIESIYQSLHQPEKYLEYVEKNRLGEKKTEAEREDMYFGTAEQVFLGGDSQQAVVSLQKYLDEYPEGGKRAQAWFYMAESYKNMGFKEKAADAYARVMELTSEGSYAENARLGYANICYSLERYADAYNGFASLAEVARIGSNRTAAATGMMRSAFRARNYEKAIAAADRVCADGTSSAALRREAEYVQAKSCLATSRRTEAMGYFKSLSAEPSTPEGAEARYILIQDFYDTGDFKAVENAVYDFAGSAGDQSYWLAKSYITLGDSFVERDMLEQAKATFESIRDGYVPDSESDDVQDNVKLRLQRLAARQ